ncbi:Transcription factor IIIC subunit 5 [Penicillium brevicompactum]|uniref:Transcription factor IIIC subunit 5 n=1 Tax=Penicillium brevicompactum TaxID=5074 RepID=UPI00254064D7|nr:Transcription factor IIIC subunit 5 [Penicillium brevicompactum]KAJ5332758.1 Transcription factor IIIC subunit 5 [Penicillium brevicompactum]
MKAAAGISDDHVCHVLGRRKFVPDDNSWQIYDISGGLLQGIMKTTHFFHLSRRFPAANRAESYPSKYRENAQIGRTLCGQNAFDRRNLATIDTLAEWLTRGPAKPVSSEAQVWGVTAIAHVVVANLHNDTLAEWLTRGPAKPVSSEAQVRILQVSKHFFFVHSVTIP